MCAELKGFFVNEDPHSVTKPSETAKGRIPSNPRGDVSWKSYSDQWKENHGTLLMFFAAAVFLVGGMVLIYQQNRFRAPAFPSAGVINRVPDSNSDPVVLHAVSDAERAGQPGVTLRVLGVSDAGGSVRIAVYHRAENFNDSDNADWKSSITLFDSKAADLDAAGADSAGSNAAGPKVAECWIPLDALSDRFAIAVYQDTNDNNELDRGLLGIPSERYGFSNAARGKVGPPSFEQASVTKPEPSSTIEIEIW